VGPGERLGGGLGDETAVNERLKVEIEGWIKERIRWQRAQRRCRDVTCAKTCTLSQLDAILLPLRESGGI
jgi:hypothetical protein